MPGNGPGGSFAEALRFCLLPGIFLAMLFPLSAIGQVYAANAPYNVKCDGVTDNQKPLQQAFDDARSWFTDVVLPTGNCLTSTIVYWGTPFKGQGKAWQTIIKGQPCQDVFVSPDSSTAGFNYAPHISDVMIEVDASCNATASFPNRIFGTAGGLTPIPASQGGPPATMIPPPWRCGNAGFAIPASDGANMPTGLNGWVWDNVQIVAINSNYASQTCGIFIQACPNALVFQHVDVQGFYGGIIEAPPAKNNTSYFAWTNDTAQYIDVNLKGNLIPMTWINGSHRNAQSISIYGGNVANTLGLFQFALQLGQSFPWSGATFGQYYFECWTPNTGELSRFSGSNDNITGGSVTQCSGTGYVNWLANNSTIDAQFGDGGVHVSGNGNTFTHQGNLTNWTNTGKANVINQGTL